MFFDARMQNAYLIFHSIEAYFQQIVLMIIFAPLHLYTILIVKHIAKKIWNSVLKSNDLKVGNIHRFKMQEFELQSENQRHLSKTITFILRIKTLKISAIRKGWSTLKEMSRHISTQMNYYLIDIISRF